MYVLTTLRLNYFQFLLSLRILCIFQILTFETILWSENIFLGSIFSNHKYSTLYQSSSREVLTINPANCRWALPLESFCTQQRKKNQRQRSEVINHGSRVNLSISGNVSHQGSTCETFLDNGQFGVRGGRCLQGAWAFLDARGIRYSP